MRPWAHGRGKTLLWLAVVWLGLGVAARGEDDLTRVRVGPESRFWLEGSTNVNRFRCRGSGLEGTVEILASPALVTKALAELDGGLSEVSAPTAAAIPAPRFQLEIPIADLSCGNRGIERDLRATLEADVYPRILYDLEGVTGFSVLGPVGAGGARYRVGVVGVIILREQRRTVRTQAYGERVDAGRFRVSGELPLRMTDFGIRPPTALFGLIRVHDDLRIRFDLRLATEALR